MSNVPYTKEAQDSRPVDEVAGGWQRDIGAMRRRQRAIQQWTARSIPIMPKACEPPRSRVLQIILCEIGRTIQSFYQRIEFHIIQFQEMVYFLLLRIDKGVDNSNDDHRYQDSVAKKASDRDAATISLSDSIFFNLVRSPVLGS